MAKYPWSDKADQRRAERRPVPKKRQAKIPNESKKRKYENKELKILTKQFLIEHPICEIQILCSGDPSTEPHHPAGRLGELLLNMVKCKATCRKCHIWITEHSKEAIELGFSESRLNKK